MVVEVGSGRRSGRGKMKDPAALDWWAPGGTCEVDHEPLRGHRPRNAGGRSHRPCRQLMRVAGLSILMIRFAIAGFVVISFMRSGAMMFGAMMSDRIRLMGMPRFSGRVIGNHVQPEAEIGSGQKDPTENCHDGNDTPHTSHQFIMVGRACDVN